MRREALARSIPRWNALRSCRERRSLAEGCSSPFVYANDHDAVSGLPRSSCRAQIYFRDKQPAQRSLSTLDGPEAWGGPGRLNRSPGRRPVEVRPRRNFLCATVVVTLAISHGRRRCSLSAPCSPRSFSRCSGMAIPASARGDGSVAELVMLSLSLMTERDCLLPCLLIRNTARFVIRMQHSVGR